MFDFSWTELLVIVVVALVAIGPKELPRVLYEVGKWAGRLRLLAGEFRRHVSDMMHEVELEELRRQIRAGQEAFDPTRMGGEAMTAAPHPVNTIIPADVPPPAGVEVGTSGYAGSPPEAEAPAQAADGADADAGAEATPAAPVAPVRQG